MFCSIQDARRHSEQSLRPLSGNFGDVSQGMQELKKVLNFNEFFYITQTFCICNMTLRRSLK